MTRLSDDFLTHFYYGIRDDYLERVKGEKKPLSEVFLGLTRNNPVVITCDKNLMPNGAKHRGHVLTGCCPNPFDNRRSSDIISLKMIT